MSSPTLLTKEQARLLKKKKAAKRTDKRFKYVNAAVAQAKILGLDKLVFVTMCEFADDDGCLWHGERSLATATGLSQPTVHRCIERLIASGAVVLLHKGKSKWDTNMYRVFAVDTEQQPTIYNVARFHRQQKQRKHKQPRLQLILCESVGGLPDSVGIGKPEELILCESKDIEFDFDPLMFSLRQGNSGRFAPSPAHLQSEDKNQSQNQNRAGSELTVVSKQKAEALLTQEAAVVQTKPNGGSAARRSPPSPIECSVCGEWAPRGYIHDCQGSDKGVASASA
jgi:hypothetical protein